MSAVTIDLTTMLAMAIPLGAGLVAWAYRQGQAQTRVEERVNWLCARYAEDHDTAVPWEEPIADGGRPMTDGGKDRGLLARLSSPNESDTEYGGFLSYAGEWHALAVGLSVGFGAGVAGRPEVAAGVVGAAFGLPALTNGVKLRGRFAVKELRREPWYGAGAALIGYAVGAVIAGTPLPV
jgi:hypothetical protein